MNCDAQLAERIAENDKLQICVKNRLLQLEKMLKHLDHFRVVLLQYKDDQKRKRASRVPLRCSSSERGSYKRIRSEGNNEYLAKPIAFLNTHQRVVRGSGTIEDPFTEAGMYADPKSVRVRFKSIPPNSDSIRVDHIESSYDLFNQRSPSRKLGLKMMNSFCIADFSQSPAQSQQKIDLEKLLSTFMRLDSSQLILKRYSGDLCQLRDKILTSFAQWACSELFFLDFSKPQLLQVLLLLLADSRFENYLNHIRLRHIALSKSCVVLSHDPLSRLLRLRSRDWVEKCRSHSNLSLLSRVTEITLSKAMIFPSKKNPSDEVVVLSSF